MFCDFENNHEEILGQILIKRFLTTSLVLTPPRRVNGGAIYCNRFMITDEEYELIRDELANGSFKGGNKPNNRLLIDAVFYIAKTGCGWRQLPAAYGK